MGGADRRRVALVDFDQKFLAHLLVGTGVLGVEAHILSCSSLSRSSLAIWPNDLPLIRASAPWGSSACPRDPSSAAGTTRADSRSGTSSRPWTRRCACTGRPSRDPA